MLSSWLTLLPPAFVIFGAIITRRIHAALALGILSASIIATKGAIAQAGSVGLQALWGTISDIDNIYLYIFLVTIGTLVALFAATGAATSFAHAVTQRIRTAQQVQYASMLVSTLLFIDDYLSILTTGYVMSPLTDRFQISREKLAFLIHSLAGPIVILAPVSSWVATIIGYIDHVGVSAAGDMQTVRIAADPFFIFLESIPFIFYSFLMILSVWFIIRTNVSYGPMKLYDQQAATRTIDFVPTSSNTAMSDLLLPLAVLVGGIIIGLPLTGGYYLFGGSHSLIESLRNNDHPFLVMLIAALCAVAVSSFCSIQKNLIRFNQLPTIIKDGFNLMIGAITMVYLASTFSGMLANQVGTGQYLASVLLDALPLWLLPVMFFIVSLICTIATGSAWGNFALMIPIAIPMLTTLSGLPLPLAPSALPLLLPVLGAILSGSVCGDHISPLSETTTMAATSTGITAIQHAYTQFPYAVPAIIGSAVGFLLTGLLSHISPWLSLAISLGISSLLCVSLIWWFNKST